MLVNLPGRAAHFSYRCGDQEGKRFSVSGDYGSRHGVIRVFAERDLGGMVQQVESAAVDCDGGAWRGGHRNNFCDDEGRLEVQGAEHAGHVAEDLAEFGRVLAREGVDVGGGRSEGDRVVRFGAFATVDRGKPDRVLRGREVAILSLLRADVEIPQRHCFGDWSIPPLCADADHVFCIAVANHGDDARPSRKDFADTPAYAPAGVKEDRVDREDVLAVGDVDYAAQAGFLRRLTVWRHDGPAGTEADPEVLVFKEAGVVR